ncbi:NAD(P)H-dependent oxidoreductase [Bacillus sp. 03113]|uniref:NAD(P)H-dependent oxidoreductase n=1 Tax=Bacillus sp. 03113 TaxID=2578211 RepID=UPI001144AF11|nr:NAD(P)H-dependent oxidoreductase [Bacillus sp. 03113]
MKNILIINGHQKYQSARGILNQTIMDEMIHLLSENYEIKTTIIQEGYEIEEEKQKFKWADVVIFQTPIFWFSVPGLLKTYMDEVYAYGLFFEGSKEYGRGGLFKDKKYMFSVTWNAPENAFNDPLQFFEGKSLDEVILHLHKIHEFIGMKPLKSFACYDVITNPNIEQFKANLQQHLNELFELS